MGYTRGKEGPRYRSKAKPLTNCREALKMAVNGDKLDKGKQKQRVL